ncbi:MAG: nickel pincer cofactor biosynthesis protein LarB [Chitinispirillia bacterium]|nr:nickel pincer cofactor biosynthesis protein LarB [Chitinispirillia bacterium]MCL2241171.1 nickel pincer cofactor biosynthesis protein LarB [Chitinispirillia bacterium]
MNKQETLDILKKIQAGEVSPDDALSQMCTEPFQDLGYAKLDHHRGLRQGVPEVIYGAGKTPGQITGIAKAMVDRGQKLVLITRLARDVADVINKDIPIQYFDAARIGIIGDIPKPNGVGRIVVAAAGTSDMPVAEEAAVTAEALGNEVVRMYDVGVAGLHRLSSKLDVLMNARVVVSVAGMEGALTSVIGGLVDCPVIGVPASVGYGASFGGISALLAMLNSCASGVSVVNIDNGFGAGYMASMINHLRG